MDVINSPVAQLQKCLRSIFMLLFIYIIDGVLREEFLGCILAGVLREECLGCNQCLYGPLFDELFDGDELLDFLGVLMRVVDRGDDFLVVAG